MLIIDYCENCGYLLENAGLIIMQADIDLQ